MNLDPQNIETLVFFAVKVGALIGLGVYTIFATVIVRQEQLMAHVLEEDYEPALRILVYVHLLCAVAVFAMAFFLL